MFSCVLCGVFFGVVPPETLVGKLHSSFCAVAPHVRLVRKMASKRIPYAAYSILAK